MKYALCFAAFLTVAPAMGADHHPRCISLADAKKAASEDHGVWTGLTNDQFQFLRGVSATHPQTPPGIPIGDKAAIVTMKGQSSALIFFIDGNRACDMFAIPDVMVKMVMDIGAGSVKHEGEAM